MFHHFDINHKLICVIVASKQTLFPVWGEREDRKPRKGVPEDDNEYTLRATKGVNMHPFPKILITKEDGSNHMDEEEVKLTLVSATDKMVPHAGKYRLKLYKLCFVFQITYYDNRLLYQL